jgi:hypothetical protein
MENKKQQGIYAIPNKVKSLFNKFISWVLHIYPSVGGQFKKRQTLTNEILEIMKLSEKLGDSKETLKKIINELNTPQFDNIDNLIKLFGEYLKNEIHTDGGTKVGDVIVHKYRTHETTGFEAHIYKNIENNNLCVKLVMPDTFGNNSVIELKPNISTPLNKIKNNIISELNSVEKQIGELKNIDRNDIVFNVVKIDCPDRQYPNQFEFDSTKEFTTIQEAMEYAVDDIMGTK